MISECRSYRLLPSSHTLILPHLFFSPAIFLQNYKRVPACNRSPDKQLAVLSRIPDPEFVIPGPDSPCHKIALSQSGRNFLPKNAFPCRELQMTEITVA